MCGRFASARKRQELLAEFHIERDRVSEELPPDYNVAPTKPVYAVLTRSKPAHGEPGEHKAARELRVVRWGLVPSWAKEVSIGSRLINARAETVDSKPAFRHAFARRRCLLPADGFYEWQDSQAGGRARKQPYFIHRADGGVLAFAGLYEIWRDNSFPDDHPKAWLWSATIITTQARDEVGRIHDRMPMVITPDRWADWLDPAAGDAGHLRSLLAPAASAAALESHPVSTEVNSVRNNGPHLIEPVTAPDSDGRESAGGAGGESSDSHAGERGPAPPARPSDGPAAPRGRAVPARPSDGAAGERGRAASAEPSDGPEESRQPRPPEAGAARIPRPQQEEARDPLTLF